MTLHLLFAENLRRKSAEFGTIADVCRGVGVNRQQFNKYLAGAAVPNAITLRKICQFLGIQERELFLENGIGQNSIIVPPVMPRRGPLGFFQFAANNFDFEVNDLEVGLYECLMPLVEVPGMVMTSLILVQQSSRQKEFVRLTRTSISTRHPKLVVRGRHKGVIFANNSEIYFLGVNRYPPHQVSFIVFKRTGSTAVGFNKGTMMTQGLNGPVSPKVCIFRAQQNDSLKRRIAGIGVHHVSQISFDKLAVEYVFS
jgi:transcriptional regulator with XRE-family HTH domain